MIHPSYLAINSKNGLLKSLYFSLVLPLILLASCTQRPPAVDLKSAVGVNYSYLDQLLQQGLWKEADQETLQKMLLVSNRQREKWLSVDHINNFPCKDLGTLDQLWEVRSQGRFGFSVQRMIWREVGGKSGHYHTKIAETFGEQVGWRQGKTWRTYDQLTFKSEAPVGHLPASTGGGVSGAVWGSIASVARRLESCDLNIVVGKQPQRPASWDTPATWRNLETHLKKREWVAADWVTLHLMENISSQGEKIKKGRPSLSLSDFPCPELKQIDQLWLKYSEGRLGFSVQQKFYLQTGNQPGELHWEKYKAFQNAVGWNEANGHQNNDYDLRYPSIIPKGYFPFRLGWDYGTFGSGFFREWRAWLNPQCNL